MTTREIAARDVQRAEVILQEAASLRGRGAWNLVVRRCQEAVELSLKGALRWAALDVPKVHDVGPHLSRHADRYPGWFAAEVGRIAEISRWLRGERESSFYGDEAAGSPPEGLYSDDDAREALRDAAFVVEACRRLVTE